jgi:TatD DNase family protein
MEAIIKALCISKERGTAKTNVDKIELIENYGLKGDAHAGSWHRQVSLLSYERVEEFKERGGDVEVGAFGENILAEGIDFKKLPIGTILRSSEVSLLVTQIGKTCHSHCEIFHQVGDCIMPREGIFAKVLTGGKLKVGDKLYVVSI